jgi:hypothetical protein
MTVASGPGGRNFLAVRGRSALRSGQLLTRGLLITDWRAFFGYWTIFHPWILFNWVYPIGRRLSLSTT